MMIYAVSLSLSLSLLHTQTHTQTHNKLTSLPPPTCLLPSLPPARSPSFSQALVSPVLRRMLVWERTKVSSSSTNGCVMLELEEVLSLLALLVERTCTEQIFFSTLNIGPCCLFPSDVAFCVLTTSFFNLWSSSYVSKWMDNKICEGPQDIRTTGSFSTLGFFFVILPWNLPPGNRIFQSVSSCGKLLVCRTGANMVSK